MGNASDARKDTVDLTASIQQVNQIIDRLGKASGLDGEQRKTLLEASRRLRDSIETPVEYIFRFVFQPHQNAAVRIALDIGAFEALQEAGEEGATATQLAERANAEPAVVVRILRGLVALGIVGEIGKEHYVSTPVSEAWISPPLAGCTKHLFDESAFSLARLPQFLKDTAYKNPGDGPAPRGPFESAFDTDLGLFQFLNQRPERLEAFNSFMEGQRRGRKAWYDNFPAENLVRKGVNNDVASVLMVDVGGGRGHELEDFRKRYPDMAGRLILEDLPETINDIARLDESMERIEYDFFTPQPVKGARAYYFRSIFHDWPDSACLSILRNTVSAMDPRHSMVLINDWVLPDEKSPLFASMMDINMMALLSGKERSETQWRELLDKAGLAIVKIWSTDRDSESIIEAVIKH